MLGFISFLIFLLSNDKLCCGCVLHAASRPEKLQAGEVEEGSNLCHRCRLIAFPFGHLCNGLSKERLTVLGGKLEEPLCIQQCAAVATMDTTTGTLT